MRSNQLNGYEIFNFKSTYHTRLFMKYLVPLGTFVECKHLLFNPNNKKRYEKINHFSLFYH